MPRFDIDVNETYQVFQTYAPEIWEELMGMQEVLNLPTKQMILNFAHYRFTDLKVDVLYFKVRILWCAIMIIILPHTMGDIYYSNLMTEGANWASRVTGRMDGMNEAGLTMGYNFMHRKHPANGFVCYMIGRLVLEYCKDVDEAVRFLKELPHKALSVIF